MSGPERAPYVMKWDRVFPPGEPKPDRPAHPEPPSKHRIRWAPVDLGPIRDVAGLDALGRRR